MRAECPRCHSEQTTELAWGRKTGCAIGLLAGGAAGIIARATAAAQRSDLTEAKRELLQLPPSDRTLVQPWIAKVDARDKALAASEQFTMDTLTAISKSAR